MEGEEEGEAACAAADDRDVGFQVLSERKRRVLAARTKPLLDERAHGLAYLHGRQPPQGLDLASDALAVERPLSVRTDADHLSPDRFHRVPLPGGLVQDIDCPAVQYDSLVRVVHRSNRLSMSNTSRYMLICRKTQSRQLIK